MSVTEYLEEKVEEGSVAAKALWESRRNKSFKTAVPTTTVPREPKGNQGENGPSDKNESGKRKKASPSDSASSLQTNKQSKEEQNGTLFKSTQSSVVVVGNDNDKTTSTTTEEGSDDYWNKERAKLGLKPLK